MTKHDLKTESEAATRREAPDVKRLVGRLRKHALPDPYDEREALHAPLLNEAADALIAAEKLCKVYFEIALSAGLTEDEIRTKRKDMFGA